MRQRLLVEVQIPEGSYDLIDIVETIKIAMKRNGHNDESIKITANTNTWNFHQHLECLGISRRLSG